MEYNDDDIIDAGAAGGGGSGERVRRDDTDLADIPQKKLRRRERRAQERDDWDAGGQEAPPEYAAAPDDIPEERGRKKRRRRMEEEEESTATLAGSDNTESEPMEEAPPRQRSRVTVKSILSGDVASGDVLAKKKMRRTYPLMIFVAALAFFYIYNVFRTQAVYREHSRLSEQVKELRAKSMTIASDKMRATRQSRIMEELDRRGIPLKESLTPNKVIPKPAPAQAPTQTPAQQQSTHDGTQ